MTYYLLRQNLQFNITAQTQVPGLKGPTSHCPASKSTRELRDWQTCQDCGGWTCRLKAFTAHYPLYKSL